MVAAGGPTLRLRPQALGGVSSAKSRTHGLQEEMLLYQGRGRTLFDACAT